MRGIRQRAPRVKARRETGPPEIEVEVAVEVGVGT
jgi:hypothetical protein